MDKTMQSQPLQSAVRKASVRLLPFLTIMLIMAFLDRVNIGFVKIAYQANTGIGDAAYAFGAGIFFLGYALFEVPSNLIMHKVGARVWLARIMVTWGIVSSAMMFAHTETSFYVIRFLLGLAEAGFYPGALLFLTYWFPSKDRARATGLFYLGVPLSLVLGSPLSGLLLQYDGIFGLTNWQTLFLVEGLGASLIGLIAFFYLCDSPRKAKWLTSAEQEALTAEIAREEALKEQQVKHTALGILKDPRVLAFISVYFCLQVGTASFTFYFPAKLASLLGGQVNLNVGLLLAIPWICSAIATRIATVYADRHDNHRAVATAMIAIGVIASASIVLTNNPWILLVAFCFAVPGLTSSQPVFWSLPTRYLSGTGAASGIAFIVSIGNLGAFISPQIKTYAEKLVGGTSAGFVAVAALTAVSVVIMLCLRPTPAAIEPARLRGAI